MARIDYAQQQYQVHKDKYERLRSDVTIKLKFLEENKVSRLTRARTLAHSLSHALAGSLTRETHSPLLTSFSHYVLSCTLQVLTAFPCVCVQVKVMHKQLLLFHNAISAYFAGNQQQLEQTLKQFNIKLKPPGSEQPLLLEEP